MKLIIATIFFLPIIFASCKKGSESQPADSSGTDILTFEQDSALSASSIPNPQFKFMLGASGGNLKFWIDSNAPNWNNTLANLRLEQTQMTSVEQYHTLINKTISAAYTLAGKKETNYLSEANNKPRQWGIAYSRGSSDYKSRLFPSEGNSLHKHDAVMGLDCGGFIETIFKAAGVSALEDFASFQFPKYFKEALPKSPYPDLELVDMGAVSPAEMMPGDVVVWSNHIGIIAFDFPLTEPFVYQSNGTGWPTDKIRNGIVVRSAMEDQKNNQEKERGVHPIKWSTAISRDYWSGGYSIWRIKEKSCNKGLTIIENLNLTGGTKKSWYLFSESGISQLLPNCPNPYREIVTYFSDGKLDFTWYDCNTIRQPTERLTYTICNGIEILNGSPYEQLVSLSSNKLIFKSVSSGSIREFRPL